MIYESTKKDLQKRQGRYSRAKAEEDLIERGIERLMRRQDDRRRRSDISR